jgi:hypothetical protein
MNIQELSEYLSLNESTSYKLSVMINGLINNIDNEHIRARCKEVLTPKRVEKYLNSKGIHKTNISLNLWDQSVGTFMRQHFIEMGKYCASLK